jgi:hypothetical protein
LLELSEEQKILNWFGDWWLVHGLKIVLTVDTRMIGVVLSAEGVLQIKQHGDRFVSERLDHGCCGFTRLT